VQNHDVQGVSYNAAEVPQFINEKYMPFSRTNMTVFFSSRGNGDYVGGLNISRYQRPGTKQYVDEPSVEMVHYPDALVVPAVDGHEQLFMVFSTHRRVGVCAWDGNLDACADSIQFVRLNDLPVAGQPAIYPNHFAFAFDFGSGQTQDAVYSYTHDENQNVLTLINRGSAGIETTGNKGVINLSFKLNAALLAGESRPVISFGRSGARTAINGLRLTLNTRGSYDLVMGSMVIRTGLELQSWIRISLNYDYSAKTISVEGYPAYFMSSMNRRVYLGDPTLSHAGRALPNLTFDLRNTGLEQLD
jgi:hypothetical protein